MSSDLDAILRNSLMEDWRLLAKSMGHLRASYDKCLGMSVKSEYSVDELERFESLTARFARVSDIYTQRILKTLVALQRELAPTFIDRVNLCEKLGIVPSAADLRAVRDLRNSISHEYLDEDQEAFFRDVLGHVPKLLSSVQMTEDYVRREMKIEVAET
ncbi:MAG TPA: hypothetical protein DCP63_13685 [Bacteroidetes bacterium]|nr:hypothetical protein [Bacteroidota bacterium]